MTSFLVFEDPVLLKVRRMAFVQERLRHIGSEAFSLRYLLNENGPFPSLKQTDNFGYDDFSVILRFLVQAPPQRV